LFSWLVRGQTFSLRYHGTSVTALLHVWELQDGYMVSGFTVDYDTSLHYDAIISKFTENGTNVFTKQYGSSNHSFFNENDCNLTLQNGTQLLAACQTIDSDTVKMALIWYDLNGDTLKTKAFKSPLWYGLETAQANWLRPYYMSSDSTGIYIACGTTDEATGNDFIILKTDPDGNLLWHYYFGVDIEDVWQDIDLCYTLCAVDDGVIMAGATQILEWGQWDLERIYKIDLNGNLIWQIDDIPEFNASIPQEMTVVNDGFVIASSIDDFENPINGQNGLIYKMDFDGNLLWWNGELEFNYATGLTCITKTCDNGFVCCGRNYESLVPPDSLDYDNNNNLIIAKYDSLGTLLWHRKYLYVNSPYDYHEMYDLKATHDGGYIMVGEATDNWQDNPNLELPRQQAWILKVDGCGCLVPGCDEFCTPPDCSPPNVVDVPKPDYFLYGPNPVENSFYIYFDGTDMELENLEFQLYDISGRLVDSFMPSESDMTYIWEMEKYAAGEYVVVLKDKGNILQSQKIAKL
jgi:hypothetical protein